MRHWLCWTVQPDQNALAQAKHSFLRLLILPESFLPNWMEQPKAVSPLPIHSELGIPVKYIGVGESIDDLQKFDADEFVNALFDVKDSEEEE